MIARARALAATATVAVSSIACGSSTLPASSPSSAQLEARVASADGVSIHYVAEGSGPAVVLSHCLGCDLHYWDVAAADLARDHRVVRLDLAGHGGSGTDRKSWTVESFAGDIRAVASAAGVERFTLVGHSMSGTSSTSTRACPRRRAPRSSGRCAPTTAASSKGSSRT